MYVFLCSFHRALMEVQWCLHQLQHKLQQLRLVQQYREKRISHRLVCHTGIFIEFSEYLADSYLNNKFPSSNGPLTLGSASPVSNATSQSTPTTATTPTSSQTPQMQVRISVLDIKNLQIEVSNVCCANSHPIKSTNAFHSPHISKKYRSRKSFAFSHAWNAYFLMHHLSRFLQQQFWIIMAVTLFVWNFQNKLHSSLGNSVTNASFAAQLSFIARLFAVDLMHICTFYSKESRFTHFHLLNTLSD